MVLAFLCSINGRTVVLSFSFGYRKIILSIYYYATDLKSKITFSDFLHMNSVLMAYRFSCLIVDTYDKIDLYAVNLKSLKMANEENKIGCVLWFG